MAKQAAYSIVINGIQQSIDAVESLNKQLDALEQRMDKLASKNINVSTSGGDGGARVSALDEEAKMLQQIEQLHQKVAASEKQEYQELLHAKEELKEYQTIAKSIAAQDNLKSGVNNLNTLQGMKAQLRDLKMAMQTVDINGDQFKKLTADANELNQKLKEIEQSYGVFSRSVGNYANGVADGMSKLKIEIGDSVVEFDNATKAYRTLKKEMETLSTKQDLGTISEEEAERLKSLVPVVKQLGSSIQDAGKPMDALLDTMQSFVAIAQGVKGISALFGLDSDAIEESIQKLVALQNVMQSLQTIQKQLQTQEGIGGWLAKSNKIVDTFAANLLKVDKNAAAASKSVKVLSTSLKVLGGVGIAAAIIAITVAIDKMKKSVENMRNTINKNMDGFEAGAQAYAKAKVELDGYIRKIDEFNGSKKAEKQLIEEVTKKYDIHNKNIKDVKDLKEFLIKMAPAYLESVRAEAETMAYAAAQANLYAKNLVLLEKQKRLEAFLDRNGGFLGGPAVAQAAEDLREVENELKENAAAIDELGKKTEEAGKKAAEAQKKLVDLGVGGGREKKIKNNSKKIEDAVRQAQNNINELRLRLMRDGLAKELLQLDENNRKEIEKIKKNGVRVQEQIALQEEVTAKERLKIWDKYNEKIIESTNQAELKAAQERINALTANIENIAESRERYFEPASTEDFWLTLFPSAKTLKEAKKMAKELVDAYGMDGFIFDDFAKMKYGNLENFASGDYFNDFINGLIDNDMLERSLDERFNIIDKYQEKEIQEIQKKVAERYDIQKAALNDEKELALKELNDRTQESLIGEIELKNLSKENGDYQRALEANNKVYQQYLKEKDAIQLEYSNREKELSKNTQDDINKFNTIFYDQSLSALNDYMSKMNAMIDKQPQYTKLGFIDLKETKNQYNEVIKTAQRSLQYLRDIQQEMLSDKNISPEQRVAISKQISDQEKQLTNIIGVAEQGIKNAKAEFSKQILDIANQVSQTAQQMISVFGDLYNYNIQKELDALDKINEKLEEKLDEQREIEERHKNEIESIEDELATSRGDRRQQLIDQLNAEMQARREAAAEQKRIEAEIEKNERKQEELEKKQAMAQYKRDLAQILISGAMAAANGFATKPFLPTGLAMGALATTLTTAQYLIAKKQKPYAKGGQLDGGKIVGKRHYAGGISVLGGTANVEGGEYITNRISTSKNIDLLDFVNSKKHKINLSELIDFYQSPKALKSLSKRVFADGGQLPTMPNIDLGDVMTDVAILRDNRPIYVAVTDINRKQDDVRRVQVLSGLK